MNLVSIPNPDSETEGVFLVFEGESIAMYIENDYIKQTKSIYSA